jgi:protein-L-isoaspartate(D-aspartate) O-methyltransferase
VARASDADIPALIDAMVERQLAGRGITDPRVLSAMRVVRRDRFVPAGLVAQAYDDHPLPIGYDVTISQPYIVALMTEALEVSPTDRVLEIGTGSGYGAAILAELGASVVTIESIGELVEPARARLAAYGDRVTVVHGDGSLGDPTHAPYDAISVTAAAKDVPPPLLEQLAPGGRLVIPVRRRGFGRAEDLVRIARSDTGARDEFRREVLTQVRFVPLTGHYGSGRE